MPKSQFEKLRVFQLAEQLADAVWDLVKTWDGMARRTVGEQLIRAADSVGANIAEGAGRGTGRDQQRFIRIARGSLNETRFWLRRAHRRNLFSPEQTETVRAVIEELTPSLNAYLQAIRRQTDNKLHEPMEEYLASELPIKQSTSEP